MRVKVSITTRYRLAIGLGRTLAGIDNNYYMAWILLPMRGYEVKLFYQYCE